MNLFKAGKYKKTFKWFSSQLGHFAEIIINEMQYLYNIYTTDKN